MRYIKNYWKLEIGIFLFILGEVLGSNSSKFIEYFYAVIIIFISCIVIFREIKNNYSIKILLKNIAGYRSDENLNKIVATIYYLLNIIIITISIFTKIGGTSLVSGCGTALVVPTMILFSSKNIKEK